MERINQWLMLAANLGVLAGIVFLGYEVRLSADAMRANTASQQAAIWVNLSVEAATNRDLLEALSAANEQDADAWNSFSVASAHAFYYASGQYKSIEFSYLQWIEGNVGDQLWQGTQLGTRTYVSNNPFMLITWALGIRTAVSPRFREYMDGMIREICGTLDCPVGGRPEDWVRTDRLIEAYRR